ncbi:hypothetical protein GUH47_13060, partial [Xanthomonas citri pv. citri]|nr:hypothetical protein [Xanthomonas citri pv. citri]
GGYRYAQEKKVTRSNVEEGIATQVRRFQQNVTSYTLTWVLEEGERELLEEFYRDTLIDGLAWCNAPFANGMGYTFVRAKFIEPIKYQSMGAAFQATAVLCTVDAPRVSELEYLTGGRISLEDT